MLPELASVLLSQFKNMIFKQSLVSIPSGLSSPKLPLSSITPQFWLLEGVLQVDDLKVSLMT